MRTSLLEQVLRLGTCIKYIGFKMSRECEIVVEIVSCGGEKKALKYTPAHGKVEELGEGYEDEQR
ncbi:MAG: hypothetical protein ACP5MH_10540 [Thermoproteus sp.]